MIHMGLKGGMKIKHNKFTKQDRDISQDEITMDTDPFTYSDIGKGD